MKRLVKNKYWQLTKDYNLDKILYLLVDRSDYVSKNIDFFWLNKTDQAHREYDLPAVIYDNGNVWWCINNKNHRKKNQTSFNLH